MASQLTYPGVYVEEKASGSRTITGVSTSTALMIGMTRLGEVGKPTPVRSFDDFEKKFGVDDTYGEMTTQVRQLFLNGGSKAIIVRAATGAVKASAKLHSEAGAIADVLELVALHEGTHGNDIRAIVDYGTPSPEATFNLTLFRLTTDANGKVTRSDVETYANVSMDPELGNFVENRVNAQSRLVTAKANATPDPADEGFSQSALFFGNVLADRFAALQALLPGEKPMSISVDAGPPVSLIVPDPGDFDTGNPGADFDGWLGEFETRVNNALGVAGQASSVDIELLEFDGVAHRSLRITSNGGKSVEVLAGSPADAAAALLFGPTHEGIEITRYSRFRPAPSALTTLISTCGDATFGSNSDLSRIKSFGGALRADLTGFVLEDTSPATPHAPAASLDFAPGGADDNQFVEGPIAASLGVAGTLRDTAAYLNQIAAAIAAASAGYWEVARHGMRISMRPTFGSANTVASFRDGAGSSGLSAADEIAETAELDNTAMYSLGAGSTSPLQSGVAGLNGTPPGPAEYAAIYSTVDSCGETCTFNLLLLPRGAGQRDDDRSALWGAASAFCQRKRAFLLIDPPSDDGAWSDVDEVASGMPSVRTGTVGDHSAIYWPRVQVIAGDATPQVDPCGTVAGIMARTDVRRGVWKAPAGLEATTLGARGLEHLVSDAENGTTNPLAVNTLRQFTSGAVVWGSRTLAGFDGSGESDYRFVPVRRLALFIEESLYRGLKFAVFEPNDEPLWAQIRLAAGAFMHNLFRQGAFQGAKKSEAYQVLCDENTTTQNDRNLGRVNVIVRFAPLKPSEFVVLTVQQLAGQVQS